MADSTTGWIRQGVRCHTGRCCNWQLKTYTSWGHFLFHRLWKSLWIVCGVGEPILSSISGLDIHAFQQHKFYPSSSFYPGEKFTCLMGALKLIIAKSELATCTEGPSTCMERARKVAYINFLINYKGVMMRVPCFWESSEIEALSVIVSAAGNEFNDLSVSLFIRCLLIPIEQW